MRCPCGLHVSSGWVGVVNFWVGEFPQNLDWWVWQITLRPIQHMDMHISGCG